MHSQRSNPKKYYNNNPPQFYLQSSSNTSDFHNNKNKNYNSLRREPSNINTLSTWLDKRCIQIHQQLQNHSHPCTYDNTAPNLDFPALSVDDLSIAQYVSPSITQGLLGESNVLPNNITPTKTQSIATPQLLS